MGVCVSWLLDARSWEAQLALNLLCRRDWSQTSALSCFVSIHHVCGVCSFMLSWYWSLMAAHQFTVDWISLWIIFIVEKGHFNNLYNFINTSKMCLKFSNDMHINRDQFAWLKDKTVFLCWVGKPTTNSTEPWNPRMKRKML